MIETSSSILLFLTFAAFSTRRGMTYMHIFQQEEYDVKRFFKWVFANKAFDKRVSFAILVAIGASFFIDTMMIHFIIFFAMTLMVYKEPDPRKDSKKKLVLTARAKRIYYPAVAISILLSLWIFVAPWQHGLWLINVHLIPFLVMMVNGVLSPFEASNQKKFWNQAHNKVMDYRPTIIGITGSYGKTSVKHILGHILKLNAPTLITPGSVNTPMGISRIIREELTEDHKFLVVEMGAYGPGSISRLCKLTPPDMGIITAIGHAHYERFKTLDAVAQTKFELAQAVIDGGEGQVIISEKTLRYEHSRDMKAENYSHFIVCGEHGEIDPKKDKEHSNLLKGDVEIIKIVQGLDGIQVRFNWKNKNHSINAPLYGVHHGHNLVMAFVAAFELGIAAQDIQTALELLPQIEHRLEVKPNKSDGTTIIDDAYNSNPVGFQSALVLLSQLGKGGRKILITPGMVELGKAHNDAHLKIGEYAGQVCDVAIVVQGKRIPSFIKGFKTTGGSKELIEVKTFSDAQKWVAKNRKEGDVILVENDLPDLYERVPKI